MSENNYFGRYSRFDTMSKKDASVLLGADCLVGDIYEIVFITEEGRRVAWMKNRFGALAGFFDPEISRQLSILEARGWSLKAILAFVAFSDSPDPGIYWGEAALICYDRAEEDAFDTFTHTVARRIAEGVRPEVDLGSQGVSRVIESKGSWSPTKYMIMPTFKSGSAIIKSRQSISDKLVEQARKRNKGCYVGSFLLFASLLALLALCLKTCGVF